MKHIERICLKKLLPALLLVSLLPLRGLCAEEGEELKTRYLMDIEEMFRVADSSNRAIRISALAVKEAEQAVKVAKNERLPSIDLSLSASYLGNVTIMERDFSNGINDEMPHFGNNLALEASYAIFTGGAISNAISIAGIGHRIASLNYSSNRQDVRLLLVGNYLEMYKLMNYREVYLKNIDQTAKLLDDIRNKAEEGVAIKNDITRYELQLQSLKLDLTRTDNAISVINDRLLSALQLPENYLIVPDPGMLETLPHLTSEQEWVDLALSSSESLEESELRIRQSEHGEKIAKSKRLPSIALFAGDKLDGPITIEVPPINKNLNYWYAGVGIRFNIASAYKSGREVKLSRLATAKAKEANMMARDNLITDVKAAHISFGESFVIYETNLKNLELAEQNYAVVNNRYLNELALITDMLDASNSKLSAELEVANAKINILFKYYNLKRVSGTL